MFDQMRPVLMCTDATLVMLMLSSSVVKRVRFRRVTDLSLTSMYVGKKRLPLVQRLALKVSVGITGCVLMYDRSWLPDKPWKK